MDHHCPWLMRCVGHANHAHFVRLLFWIVVGCTYVAAVAARPFAASLGSGAGKIAGAPAWLTPGGGAARVLSHHSRLQMAFVMASTVGVAVAGLFW